MAYLIRVGEKSAYYSGKEDALFVDQVAEAKEYATKKEADKELKEIAEALGYSTLNAVKAEDATSVERVVEEASAEEPVWDLNALKAAAAAKLASESAEEKAAE